MMYKIPKRAEYYLSIARAVANAATCPRANMGAVIVKDDCIISTGYNGAARGLRHCDHSPQQIGTDEYGDPIYAAGDMIGGHCVNAIHAEENAILQAAKNGGGTDEATIYITATPCWRCTQRIINAGIKMVVYENEYRPDERVTKALDRAGVILFYYAKEEGE